MQAAGLTPNRVTASILLKNLNADSSYKDVLRTMALTENMPEPMDEVLLSSIVEACVRIKKHDLLCSRLKQLQEGSMIEITGAHTFGSLIKAHGHAKDMEGAWRCWKDMR